MKTMLKSLRSFWFAEAPAERLAALRLIIGLFSLGYLIPRYEMFMDMSRQSADLFEPLGVMGWMSQPMAPGLFQTIFIATLLLNVAFILGWRFRFTGPAFALMLLVTLCYRNSWSMIFHNDNVLVFHALILGLTPAADAWSVDARRRKGSAGSLLFGPTGGAGWQYGWPIRLMGAIALAPYVLSGIAKIAGPMGLAWVTGNVMRDQVATDTLRKIVLGTSSSDAIYMLYNQPTIFLLFGLMTVVVELGAPLFFLHRKSIWLWAAMAYLMHWGILFIMDITFRYQLTGAMFACFFPAEYAVRWLMSKCSGWSSGGLRSSGQAAVPVRRSV